MRIDDSPPVTRWAVFVSSMTAGRIADIVMVK
jgi:hypothetical protein